MRRLFRCLLLALLLAAPAVAGNRPEDRPSQPPAPPILKPGQKPPATQPQFKAAPPVRAEGTVVSLKDGILTVNQESLLRATKGEKPQIITIPSVKFYVVKETKFSPADWKPAANAKVKLVFQLDKDGKKNLLEVAR